MLQPYTGIRIAQLPTYTKQCKNLTLNENYSQIVHLVMILMFPVQKSNTQKSYRNRCQCNLLKQITRHTRPIGVMLLESSEYEGQGHCAIGDNRSAGVHTSREENPPPSQSLHNISIYCARSRHNASMNHQGQIFLARYH